MSEELDTQVSHEEQVTSQEPELDLDLTEESQDTEETTAEVSDDVEALKAKLAEVENKNKQLFARLKKGEPEKKPTNSQPEGDLDWKRKIEFITTKGRSLDADDVDDVIAYAKGKGITYEEALAAPVIKNHLRVKQAKAKVANAIPPTSSGSTQVNGKSWKTMSEDERAANFNKVIGKMTKRA